MISIACFRQSAVPNIYIHVCCQTEQSLLSEGLNAGFLRLFSRVGDFVWSVVMFGYILVGLSVEDLHLSLPVIKEVVLPRIVGREVADQNGKFQICMKVC
jgi:hypothetical protein